jgi:hypothetical protein
VVELREWLVSDSVAVIQSPADTDMSKEVEGIVRIHHQAKTGEDFVFAVVTCKVCELVTALQSLVIISCVYVFNKTNYQSKLCLSSDNIYKILCNMYNYLLIHKNSDNFV